MPIFALLLVWAVGFVPNLPLRVAVFLDAPELDSIVAKAPRTPDDGSVSFATAIWGNVDVERLVLSAGRIYVFVDRSVPDEEPVILVHSPENEKALYEKLQKEWGNIDLVPLSKTWFGFHFTGSIRLPMD